MYSKLQAVNEVLAGVGEAPVSSLSSGFVTASTAADKIDAISREVQEKGWYFNTEPNTPLVPDFEGYIHLPHNVLRVDSSDIRKGTLVQRGLRLFDLHQRSYKFKRPVTVDIVVELPFEELPAAAQRFITLRAKRIFQADFMGDPTLQQMQTPDETEAMMTLKQMESETGDYNIFDNYDLADWIRRDIH